MGQSHSTGDKYLYKQLKHLLYSSQSKLPKEELKNLLEWTLISFPNVDRSAVFTKEFWDTVRNKLFNNISRRDFAAAELVPACRALVEILAAKERPAVAALKSAVPAASLQQDTPTAFQPNLVAPTPTFAAAAPRAVPPSAPAAAAQPPGPSPPRAPPLFAAPPLLAVPSRAVPAPPQPPASELLRGVAPPLLATADAPFPPAAALPPAPPVPAAALMDTDRQALPSTCAIVPHHAEPLEWPAHAQLPLPRNQHAPPPPPAAFAAALTQPPGPDPPPATVQPHPASLCPPPPCQAARPPPPPEPIFAIPELYPSAPPAQPVPAPTAPAAASPQIIPPAARPATPPPRHQHTAPTHLQPPNIPPPPPPSPQTTPLQPIPAPPWMHPSAPPPLPYAAVPGTATSLRDPSPPHDPAQLTADVPSLSAPLPPMPAALPQPPKLLGHPAAFPPSAPLPPNETSLYHNSSIQSQPCTQTVQRKGGEWNTTAASMNTGQTENYFVPANDNPLIQIQENPKKQISLFPNSFTGPSVPVFGTDFSTQNETLNPDYSLTSIPKVQNPQKCFDNSQFTDWHEVRRLICKEESLNLLAMPVLFSQQAEGPRTWTAIPPHEIKELRKAVKDSGICSPYFKQLLKSMIEEHTLTPNDCKNLASVILTDSQYMLWEHIWRRMLTGVLTTYRQSTDATLRTLTISKLTGEHPDDRNEDQVNLPRIVFDDIKKMARRAFLQIQPAGSFEKAYNLISQELSEPFTAFADRVIQAAERQCGDDIARPIMIRDIIENNANAECKRVIKALGKQRPTVPEMIEACNKIGSPQQVAAIQANELGKTLGEKIERAVTAQATQAEARDQKLTEILAALHLG
ncbi:RNA-binding protein 33-like [Prinia subflava]|uniref:RNA-binding protein 33-like n=1 Tax=Prinia subflava TaxID=208062 RepID=UPI002FDF2B07